MVLTEAVGTLYDLLVAVGPEADGMIKSSRRRLLALMRAGDADGAAAEMEHHLRVLCLTARLPGTTEPGGIAV
jgi:DNA-binding GntR family transcriptional regulator